ncbi:hypothetical protein [Polaromonas sp. YR568]|uniref:hypothetical protein n=1 Tax=Polaromonas sp. YR568 TaxID=1855301 RepID=UPI00398BF3F2
MFDCDQYLESYVHPMDGMAWTLLLDEQAAWLSSKDKRKPGLLLREIAGSGSGTGMVAVGHDDQMAALALSLADHAYVLESGRVAAQGTAQSLMADGSLVRAYLGAEAVPV